MTDTVIFYDADKDIEITSDLSTFNHLTDPKILSGLDLEPGDTATDFGYLIPPLGRNKWDGHIYVSGATGSGKSFFINKMLLNDKRKRKVFLFTDFTKKDESLKGMFDTGRLKVVRTKPSMPWEVSHENFATNMDKSIVVFDDCKDNEAIELRDNILEKGRHRDIVSVCVNHKLRESTVTKRPLNESKYVIAFPASNRGAVSNFLKDWFDMNLKARKAAIKVGQIEGRHMILHMFSPNSIASQGSVILI